MFRFFKNMNSSSLSTVENLFSSTQNQTNAINQMVYNSRINSFNMSSMNSEDSNNLDKVHIRASPSFNDSEPPSYFEAIGITHHAINLNTDASALPLQQERMPKLNVNKEDVIEYTPNIPHHQRHHVIRTQNLPPSLYHQNQRYNFSYCSSNTNNSMNSVNYLKPSETYMVWSIFTTVYCVFIGVVALVLSIKVHHFNKQGDYRRAYSRSKIARNINIAGLFFGIIYMGIGLLACFLPVK